MPWIRPGRAGVSAFFAGPRPVSFISENDADRQILSGLRYAPPLFYMTPVTFKITIQQKIVNRDAMVDAATSSPARSRSPPMLEAMV